jgi:CheY-like chemotaxis protein
MLKRILTKECKVLDEAEDGIDAVNKVMKSMKAGQPYDLVLMDGNMPRYVFLSALLTEYTVVVTSMYTGWEDMRRRRLCV